MKKRVLSFVLALATVISLFSAMAVTASAASYSISVNTSNWYGIQNVASGKYLNVYGNGNANNVNVTLWDWDGTSGVYYKFIRSGSKYIITPKCATGRALNVYGDSAKAGSNVCIWSKTGHSTQAWSIEYVPAQKGYIFRSANNKNVALAASGKGNGSNVYLKKYNTNDKYQIWKCAGITAKENASNGSSSSNANAVSNLKISPSAYPTGDQTVGFYYSLKGTVSSNYKITSLKGQILTSDGKDAVTPVTVYPNSTSYKIDNSTLDSRMYYNKLSKGAYYTKYTATDASGNTVSWGSTSQSQFTVKEVSKEYTLYWPFTSKVGSVPVTSDAKARIDKSKKWGDHYHAGIDFGAAAGSTILAVADGEVVACNDSGHFNSERGYYVAIYHSNLKLTTVYQHMSAPSSLKIGQRVIGGKTVIGRVGSTGNSTGPHLHLEIIKTDSKSKSNVNYGWNCAAVGSSQLGRIVTSKQINWIKR